MQPQYGVHVRDATDTERKWWKTSKTLNGELMFACSLSHVTHFSIVCKVKLQVFRYLHDYRDVIPFWADGRLPDQIFAKKSRRGRRRKKEKNKNNNKNKQDFLLLFVSPVILLLRCLLIVQYNTI